MKDRVERNANLLMPGAIQSLNLLIAALLSLSGCGGKHASAYKCELDLPVTFTSVSGANSFAGISSMRQIGSSNVKIDWVHATGVLGYMVVDVSNSKPHNLFIVPAPINTYTVTGLTAGATYSFKVQALQANCAVIDPSAGKSIQLAAWKNTYSFATNTVSSYMAAPTLQTILGSSAIGKFSISVWHKAADATPSQYSGIYGSSSTGVWNDGFGMAWEAAGVARFFINSYNVHYVEYTVPMPNSWNHYVVTYDNTLASNNLKLYVNGAIRSQHTYNATLTVPTSASLDFGRLQSNATRVSGNFDEAAIWSSALAASEVNTLYNAGHPIDPTQNAGNYVSSSHLKSYWMMGDRASYPTIYNEVIDAPDATIWNGLAADIMTDVP